MKAPRFWWEQKSVISLALRPFAMIYGAISARRMMRKGFRSRWPVICIGNLVAGGAGKTPTALWLAKTLKTRGYRPVFLTRGYGGTDSGPVLVDLSRHTARDMGDEAMLLARVAPTIIAHDRVAGVKLASTHGDLVIMDDGLQNPSLEKQMTIVVIDRKQGIGNGFVIPAGPLRAPLSVQAKQIDACLIIGQGEQNHRVIEQIRKPAFYGRLIPDVDQATKFKGTSVFAFAGIGQPEKFFDTLVSIGALVKRSESFADHHAYSRETILSLIRRADSERLLLITTAKDMARIQAVASDVAEKIAVLDVDLVCDDRDALITMVINRITRTS